MDNSNLTETSTVINNFEELQRDKELLLSLNLGLGDKLTEMLQEMKGIIKVPTYIEDLDKLLGGGVRPGITTVGAITTAGKTTFALQIAESMSIHGTQVVYYSNDMSIEYIIAKNLSRCSYKLFAENGFDANTILKMLTEESSVYDPNLIIILQEYKKISNNIRFIDTFRASPLPAILTEMEIIELNIKRYAGHGIKTVFIIDYLQNLPSNNFGDIKSKIEENMAMLLTLANSYKVPIILVSSISRSYYNQQLSLDAFKESGFIEYSSEIILGLQYEGVGTEKFQLKQAMKAKNRKMELVILKNKLGVAGDKIAINFNAKFNIFSPSIVSTPMKKTSDTFKF